MANHDQIACKSLETSVGFRIRTSGGGLDNTKTLHNTLTTFCVVQTRQRIGGREWSRAYMSSYWHGATSHLGVSVFLFVMIVSFCGAFY